ncbi:hypothetical protein BH10PSE5_BH10PSE5_06350 [soil metagenome]
MDGLDRKDVPFGWVLWIQEFLAARKAKRRARPWGDPPRGSAGDLHWLAGPH